ncbi:DUF3007 family protein [Lyngbya confervoides]|uniref:DUF3007 family protein n=1 Tax=Lyngbya confervoides BDU141951 TaxID=1574623 RepID=A0ABD4T8X8_9CYAN|nr:DUF3007 family protein [Lyngbya confervoides]MCM1985233.1 DUF3007 family protein [Lyngbya confervoides BDU141951]
MRRIDIVLLGLGIFLGGGLIFLGLRLAGLSDLDAGRWSQLIFVLGLLGWVSTYLIRVNGKKMTYHQQLQDYEDAVLEKRLAELTPEELEALQAEDQSTASPATPAAPSSDPSP